VLHVWGFHEAKLSFGGREGEASGCGEAGLRSSKGRRGKVKQTAQATLKTSSPLLNTTPASSCLIRYRPSG
jgi:hypothetical protein